MPSKRKSKAVDLTRSRCCRGFISRPILQSCRFPRSRHLHNIYDGDRSGAQLVSYVQGVIVSVLAASQVGVELPSRRAG
eukprot:scaffold436963_cov35-Prasinocladus_malaysianus.AAC.1